MISVWFRAAPVCAALALALFASSSGHAGTDYQVVYTFKGGPDDGATPDATVTFDKAGNLYGTTVAGGGSGNCDSGCGTVFVLSPDGTETTLHSFAGADGAYPYGDSVIYDESSGKIFGITNQGGDCSQSFGCGVLYKLAPGSSEKVLHNFSTTGAEGFYPTGKPLRDKAGTFYGVTSNAGEKSFGAVYKMTRDGAITVLHAFTGGADGAYPSGGLIKDSMGNLYGMAQNGGANGYGVVFKIAPDGSAATLHSFDVDKDGSEPYNSRLVRDKKGNLYGTTEGGGPGGYGTVFKLTPTGRFSVLYSFTGGIDGGRPQSDLLKIGHKLYGVTPYGGDPTCACGVLFEVDMKGNEKVLHAFQNSDHNDGAYPFGAGLAEGPDGFLYGATENGGRIGSQEGYGTVFRIRP